MTCSRCRSSAMYPEKIRLPSKPHAKICTVAALHVLINLLDSLENPTSF